MWVVSCVCVFFSFLLPFHRLIPPAGIYYYLFSAQTVSSIFSDSFIHQLCGCSLSPSSSFSVVVAAAASLLLYLFVHLSNEFWRYLVFSFSSLSLSLPRFRQLRRCVKSVCIAPERQNRKSSDDTGEPNEKIRHTQCVQCSTLATAEFLISTSSSSFGVFLVHSRSNGSHVLWMWVRMRYACVHTYTSDVCEIANSKMVCMFGAISFLHHIDNTPSALSWVVTHDRTTTILYRRGCGCCCCMHKKLEDLCMWTTTENFAAADTFPFHLDFSWFSQKLISRRTTYSMAYVWDHRSKGRTIFSAVIVATFCSKAHWETFRRHSPCWKHIYSLIKVYWNMLKIVYRASVPLLRHTHTHTIYRIVE